MLSLVRNVSARSPGHTGGKEGRRHSTLKVRVVRAHCTLLVFVSDGLLLVVASFHRGVFSSKTFQHEQWSANRALGDARTRLPPKNNGASFSALKVGLSPTMASLCGLIAKCSTLCASIFRTLPSQPQQASAHEVKVGRKNNFYPFRQDKGEHDPGHAQIRQNKQI